MLKVNEFMIEKRAMIVRTATAMAVVLAMVLLLAMTAFAETTYVIQDGDTQITHRTDATEPAEVLEEAGVALGADDLVTTEEGLGRATITIRRAAEITVNYYGRPITGIAYEDETLGHALQRMALTCDKSDVLSMPLDTLVHHGLNFSISTVEVKEETYTAAVPYEIEFVEDDNMAKGVQKIRTEGKDGEKNVTAAVTYTNGVETDREVLHEEVTLEPVKQIVSIGTGKNLTLQGPVGDVVIGNGTITLSNGQVLTYKSSAAFKATAYTHTDAGCNTITATGTTVRWGTVAVDPRVIPYGTKMFIITNDGSFVYGVGTAEDCGGGIKGNRLDLYFPTYSQCVQFGVRNCTVYFLT